jgi:hypothetical protein
MVYSAKSNDKSGKQFSPLRCGMTNKETNNSKNKERRNTGVLHFVQDDGEKQTTAKATTEILATPE